MDDKCVKLEVLKVAAANCRVFDSLDIVRHAKIFEQYVLGSLQPSLEPVVKKPKKKKATTKK